MNRRQRHKREMDMSRRALELHTKKIVHSTKMYNLMADIFNLGSQLNEDMNDFSDKIGGEDADMESEENLEKFIEHVGATLMPRRRWLSFTRRHKNMNWKVLLVRAVSTRRGKHEEDAEGEKGLG